MSDRSVVKWRERRGGVWYPEDRLRAAIPGALFLVPLSVIFSGLLVQFVPGKIGSILNLVCLFVNGFGVCGGILVIYRSCINFIFSGRYDTWSLLRVWHRRLA